MLKAHGYQVNAFDNAEAFFSGMEAATPGVLVVGIDLPDRLARVPLMRTVRGRAPHWLVVIVSGQAELRPEAEALGVAAFLHKPFMADALLELLAGSASGDD